MKCADLLSIIFVFSYCACVFKFGVFPLLRSKYVYFRQDNHNYFPIFNNVLALAVVPGVCPISAAGGKSVHKLVNQCGSRLAFKVKCSNNGTEKLEVFVTNFHNFIGNYWVSPVYGIVEVSEQGTLEINRKAGKPKVSFFSGF